jgi:uncharacterized protein (TIGR02001 family)
MLHLPTTLRLNSPHQQSKNVFAALVLSHRFGYMAPEMKPLAALLVFLLAASPAVAQLRLGESGLALNPTTTVTSDYIFRGISQTRSRPAAQANVELLHPGSGVYIGSFVSNAQYQSYDVTTEIDLFGGIRFPLGSFNLDILGIWYHYAGLTRRGAQPRLDYVEAILRASRSFGPVTLLATLGASPNYFASSGTGLYFEGGLDWQTGLWGLTLSGRLAHQMLERPANFGAGNYTWWGVNLTRDFAIDGLGTLTATLSYVQTSIDRDHCVPIGGRGQDICGARALGSLGFRF